MLFRDGGQVLAWRFTDGAVNRVARLSGTVSGGQPPDRSYDTVVAVAQP